jgi:hypothetical protein
VARLTVTGTASLERISAEVSIGKKNPARGRALSATVMSINTSGDQR